MDTKTVCVFCGASDDVPVIFKTMAYDFGKQLAAKGLTLVYGGAKTGLMGAVADGCLSLGGKVIGVYPDILNGKEAQHGGLSEFIQTESMHERKRVMYDRSDSFVVLPGGFGTMDELFECATWKILNSHQKPIIMYNYLGYWDSWLKMINNFISHGFARGGTRSVFQVHDDMQDVLNNV